LENVEISADAGVDEEVSVVVEVEIGVAAFAGVEVEVAVMIIITHPIRCLTREDVAEGADMAMGLQWAVSKHLHT
jgi:hypothetical protein